MSESMEVDEPIALEKPITVFFGNNSSGQIAGVPVADRVSQPQPAPSSMRFVNVAFGDSHAVGLTEGMDVYTWGLEGARGQLGHGESLTDVSEPRRVATLDGLAVKDIACGGEFTLCCAGSDLLAFGANDLGQLGLGPGGPLQTFKPRPVPLFRSLSLPVVHVACGSDFALAVTHAGSVFGWGSNAQGQLGLGRGVPDCATPQPIEGLWALHVVQVAVGEAHSLALTAGGRVYSWGRNKAGQLGLGAPAPSAQEDSDLELSFTPAVKAPVIMRWVASLTHMGFDRRQAETAIAMTGSTSLEHALEWALAHPAPEPSTSGRGASAAAASSSAPSAPPRAPLVGEEGSPHPVMVPGLPRITAIAAGGSHSAAIDDQGALFTWGRGRQGQLGQGSLEDQPAPRKVSLEAAGRAVRVRSVACGALHTLALTTDGRLIGCGSNESGTLGHLHGASRTNEFVPLDLPLPPGSAIDDIFAGGHCSALSLRPASAPRLPLPSAPSALDRLRELVARAASIDLSRDSSYETRALRERAVKDVLAMIDAVFRSPSAVVSTMLPLGLGPDLTRLADQYRSLLELYDSTVIQALLKALTGLAEAIRDNATLMSDSERALCLLPLLQCPLLSEPRYAAVLIPPLGEAVARFTPRAKATAARLISRYPKELLGAYCVRPLLTHIKGEVERGSISKSVFLAITVLEVLHRGSVLGGNVLDIEEFYSDILSDLILNDNQLLVTTYTAWIRKYAPNSPLKPAGPTAAEDPNFTLCDYPFLLSPMAKSRLLRVESELNMAQYINASRQETLQRFFNEAGGFFGFGGAPAGPGPGGLHDPLELDRVAPRTRKARPSPSAPPPSSAPPQSSHPQAQQRPPPQGPMGDFMRFVYGLGGPVADIASAVQTGYNVFQEITGTADAQAGGLQGGQLPPPDACGVPATHQDFCVLRIRRTHLLEDALEEIARQRPRDLHKPLKVHMIGEEGVDAGGVKKEFFQLLVQALLDPNYSLFIYQPETRTYWFNPHTLESSDEFQLAGIAVGLAIYNSVLLDLPFPLALYKKFMGQRVGLSDLSAMQPTLAKSLSHLLAYNGEHGSVEDVFCQTFAVEVEVFGQVRTFPLKPGGADLAVTEANRLEYVELYCDFVLNKSIERQFEAFQKGFLMLCGGPVLRLIEPAELEQLVCGTPHLDFRELRKGAKYEGGYSADSQAVQWLWQILDDYNLEERKNFLKFWSGSDRAPIGGLGQLHFTVQRAGPDSDRLPSSSTCFNILLLPDYSSRAKMRHLLGVAIANSSGFGLQ